LLIGDRVVKSARERMKMKRTKRTRLPSQKRQQAQPAVDPAELHRLSLEFDRGFPDQFALVVEESLDERERRGR
jgi:hypothetical protein